MKFYKCSVCGKIMASLNGPDTGAVCCWMPMREVRPPHFGSAPSADACACADFDDSSCVPPVRHEGAYLYAQARRYL